MRRLGDEDMGTIVTEFYLRLIEAGPYEEMARATAPSNSDCREKM